MATQKHEGDGSGNLLVISQHCCRNITTEVCCVCVCVCQTTDYSVESKQARIFYKSIFHMPLNICTFV